MGAASLSHESPQITQAAMLERCRWVPDFCTIDPDWNIESTPPKSDIASFRLHGVHTAYATCHEVAFSNDP